MTSAQSGSPEELGAALSKHREHMEVAGVQKNVQIAKILGLNRRKSILKTHNQNCFQVVWGISRLAGDPLRRRR